MKRHICLFENFEEAFDDYIGSSRNKEPQDLDSNLINELIELANQYTDEPINMPVESNIEELQLKLTELVSKYEGPEIGEEFAHEAEQLINSHSLQEKKKLDKDGDGDTDFIDAKITQYEKGGIKKGSAIKKAKVFAKTNNIPDNGIKHKIDTKQKAPLEKPGRIASIKRKR